MKRLILCTIVLLSSCGADGPRANADSPTNNDDSVGPGQSAERGEQPRWVLLDRNRSPVNAAVSPIFINFTSGEDVGELDNPKLSECFFASGTADFPMAVTAYSLARGSIADCAPDLNDQNVVTYHTDQSCSSAPLVDSAPRYLVVDGEVFASWGFPRSLRPPDLYRLQGTSCSLLDPSLSPNLWNMVPVPAKILNAFGDGPYVFEWR